MLEMPTLETERLLIRPFVLSDLSDVHRVLDLELGSQDFGSEHLETIEARREWLQWSILNYKALARLNQPPYGDRALLLKQEGIFIGACGFVPCLLPFEQLRDPSIPVNSDIPGFASTQFGLFYAISPGHQRQGYATEAAEALTGYAFQHLHLKRIIATTNYENNASIGVMRSLGMRLLKNPHSEPAWLQLVGVLENSSVE